MFVALAMIMGCPAPEDTATEIVTPPPTGNPWEAEAVTVVDGQAVVEVLSTQAAASAAPLPPADLVTVQGDEAFLLDPFGAGESFAGDLPPIHEATWHDGTLWLATDDTLISWNQGLIDNELASLVGRVELMLSRPSGLWMDTADGVQVLRDGVLQRVLLDGEPTSSPAFGRVGAAPVVWVAHGDTATAVRFVNGELQVFESQTLFGAVEGLSATADGRVFALVEGWLVERRSEDVWVRWDVGEPVRALRGRRGGPAIWARTDTRWLHVGDAVTATQVPVAVDAREDDHGRLVVADEQGVRRFSLGLPLLLLDVPRDNVLGQTTVRVIPTAPDLDPALTLTATDLGGTMVDVPIVAYEAVLDEALLVPGVWELAASADYGTSVETAGAQVVMGADFVPTWPEHIQPIYQSACTPCHEPGGGPVPLSTEADWVTYLDRGVAPGSPGILDLVVEGTMPPSGPGLDDVELFLLRSWRDQVVP